VDLNLQNLLHFLRARGNVVGSGIALQAGRSRIQLGLLIDLILPVSTQLLKEMSTRSISCGVKVVSA